MEDIGRILREARETLGLTLDEVERHTRIRVHNLEAMERGDMSALPSAVQARGFLKNYADFLGLDSDELLLSYAEALQSRRKSAGLLAGVVRAGPKAPPRLPPRRLRWLSMDLFIAVAVSLAIVGVVIWGAGRVLAALRERSEEVQMASEFLISTYPPSPSAQPAAATVTYGPDLTAAVSEPGATVSPTVPLPAGRAVNLRVAALGWAWMKVSVDGAERYRGRLAPGEQFDFQGDRVVEVVTGDGGALRVFFNGEDQGRLGAVGEVVIRLWTTQGALTPTPTATAPPTATPPPTPTSRPSPTPPPSRVPATPGR